MSTDLDIKLNIIYELALEFRAKSKPPCDTKHWYEEACDDENDSCGLDTVE